MADETELKSELDAFLLYSPYRADEYRLKFNTDTSFKVGDEIIFRMTIDGKVLVHVERNDNV